MLGDIASVATLILFCIYFVGRVFTIFSVKRMWHDKVFPFGGNYSDYNIVDTIPFDGEYRPEYSQVLVSKEGIRNCRVFSSEIDEKFFTKKGKVIFSRDFLNVDEALEIPVEMGELFPTLYIEYNTMDYMKVEFAWQDNMKSGVFSEFVEPKHTIKSVLYYMFR